jgi:hypothetical protein
MDYDSEREMHYRRMLEEAHQRFIADCEPARRILEVVYAIKLPKRILYPDGRFETEYEFTETEQQALKTADEIVAWATSNYRRAVEVIPMAQRTE